MPGLIYNLSVQETGGEVSVSRGRKLWISKILFIVFLFVFISSGPGYANTTYSCEDGIHEFESHIRVLNTEDTQGEVENICIICGYSYIEYLPATGHQFGEWETVDENTKMGIRTEKRVCLGCHRSEFREVPIRVEWKANQMDYLLSASIGGIWGYGALALWYDGLVLNWYKKNSRINRKRRYK